MRARDDRLSWFRVDSDLPQHPKIVSMALAAGCSIEESIGRLVRFWAWVAQYRCDGKISNGDLEAMRRLGLAVDELIGAAFIERSNGDGWRARNWLDFNGYNVRERARKARADSAEIPRETRAESAPTGRDGTYTLESQHQNTSSPDGDGPPPLVLAQPEIPGTPPGEVSESEWLALFHEHFWPDFPNKLGKVEAVNRWRKLKPRTQATCDSVFAGLDFYREKVWPDRPKDKIERASTWLNNGRWKDAS